jgi:hypothetical protein
LLTLPATAAEWVRVKTSGNNNIYSVDAATIEGRGRIRNFWSHIEFGKPQSVAGKLAHSAIYYVSADCQDKVYGLRFTRFLDQNSRTIKEDNYGDRAGLVKPASGSGEEASIKFVCSRQR